MKKKIIVLSLAAVLCAVLVVVGTLAYFTDSETATNTFTVGDLDITLTETEWDPDAAHKVVPGANFDKNPVVTLDAGSEDAWIRAQFVFDAKTDSQQAALEALVGSGKITLTGLAGDGWLKDGAYYYYTVKLEDETGKNATSALFTDVNISGAGVSVADLAGISGGFDVIVTAQAVQVISDSYAADFAAAAADLAALGA
ncbi:MAG: TasA family protein [Oscillospiraceae bacterium]|nr:TasA family protein [Oscillospiraceae bacterium]